MFAVPELSNALLGGVNEVLIFQGFLLQVFQAFFEFAFFPVPVVLTLALEVHSLQLKVAASVVELRAGYLIFESVEFFFFFLDGEFPLDWPLSELHINYS